MKVSVFIPCIDSHFEHVFKTVQAYKTGTAQPEELVVFSSGMKNVDNGLINKFRNNFPDVKLVLSDERVYAGPARQMAKELTTGDIISYQDADDLPHKRRIQFIKHFFTITDAVSVHHSWQTYDPMNADDIDLSKTKFFHSRDMYDTYYTDDKIENCRNFSNAFGGGYGINVHAGVPSFRREVLDDDIWRHPDKLQFAPPPLHKTEDFEASNLVWFKYNKGIIIDAPIYYYKV